MSEPIQSIAQNNYILHNIDAKKLYVQEPLFTANSGDAVYVGWRPDETVLWSGSINLSANPVITANESLQNFERVEFIGKGYPTNYDTTFGTCFFNSQSNDSTVWLFGHAGGSNGGAIRFNQCRISASNNILAIEQSKQFNITGTATTTANTPALLTKIVGINRKENA